MDLVELITLTLEIPGIRPALFPAALRPALDELRRFRHLIHHAYDLQLRADRIQELANTLHALCDPLTEACEDFVRQVARANAWSLPPNP